MSVTFLQDAHTPKMYLIKKRSKLIVPVNCTPDYWKRHELSELDILSIIKEQTPHTLVKMCIHFGIPIPAACIKVCIASNEMFTFSGKVQARKQVCDFIKNNVTFSPNDKLVDANYPTHRIGKRQFAALKSALLEDVSYTQVNEFPFLTKYRGVRWVPVCFQTHFILIRKVLPDDDVPKTLIMYRMRGFTVKVENKIYVSTDESALVYCN